MKVIPFGMALCAVVVAYEAYVVLYAIVHAANLIPK